MKITGIILSAVLFCGVSFAQTKKAESSIQLSFFKKADNSKTVSALVMGKNKDNKFLPAGNAHISFYAKKDKELVLLTKTITDGRGKTSATLPKDLPLDADRYFGITVKLENDSAYENSDEELRLKDINLAIKLNPNDTARIVTATVTETTADGTGKGVKDVPINFYVQRLFGNMPAAEDHTVNTNEKGEAVFTCPKGIPGDTAGNMTIVAMIDDNDTYGTVESKSPCKWGVVLPIDKDPFPRAIWGAKAQWGMIISLSILYGGVWASYIFMAFQLRKIKKEENELTT